MKEKEEQTNYNEIVVKSSFFPIFGYKNVFDSKSRQYKFQKRNFIFNKITKGNFSEFRTLVIKLRSFYGGNGLNWYHFYVYIEKKDGQEIILFKNYVLYYYFTFNQHLEKWKDKILSLCDFFKLGFTFDDFSVKDMFIKKFSELKNSKWNVDSWNRNKYINSFGKSEG